MNSPATEQSQGFANTTGCYVVVPCYNEESRLPSAQFAEFLSHAFAPFFVFVNDGSSDGTLKLLQSIQAKHPDHVHVINQQPNKGKAEAVRAGMLWALSQEACSVTGFWDADLATPLDMIPDLLAVLNSKEHFQMVFGARVHLLGRTIVRTPSRHYLGRIFATAVANLLDLPIYDSQCGAKLFRATPDLRRVLAEPFLSRWIFDVEIIARFMKIHAEDPNYVRTAVCEVPLRHWEDVSGSKVKPTDFFRALYELLQIRRTHRK